MQITPKSKIECAQDLPLPKISWTLTHNFVSNLVNKQTNRQTNQPNTPTNQTLVDPDGWIQTAIRQRSPLSVVIGFGPMWSEL